MRFPWLILPVVAMACGSPVPRELMPEERREAAYRANNRGVAHLEQYQHEAAVTAFREALAIEPGLRLAQINLPIALFYAGNLREAAVEGAAARDRYPAAPQPHYILGLIDRAENRLEPASAAFRRVLEIDPRDVGARVNLALIDVQRRRYAEAAAMCREALAVEPYNATAAYNLAIALARLGDEGAAGALRRFEELRTVGYAVTYAQTYLEQGRYAEAAASTGAEAGGFEAGPFPVSFVDATTRWVSAQNGAAAPSGRDRLGGVTLADLDGDGDLDLVVAGQELRVLRNDGAATRDVTRDVGLYRVGRSAGVVTGDVDNDTRTDLLALTPRGPRLFLQREEGRFAEFGGGALSAARGAARAAALVDVDHDGDLDILLGGAGSRLLRNNGDRTFADVTATAAIDTAGVVAVAATDFDNRRDVDLLLVRASGPPRLFQNLRTGAFADVAPTVGFPAAGAFSALALGDVNKDGFVDLFLGRSAAPGLWAISDGRAGFRVENAPPSSRDAAAAQIVDYDNDGRLDLVTAGPEGVRVFRNSGGTWSDETTAVLSSDFQDTLRRRAPVVALAAGDIDMDGDTDLVASLDGGDVRIWQNEGGHRNPSLRVRLQGRVSNRQGIGARVEMRAGSLFQQIETGASSPASVPADILFGLGARDPDVVRVLWPAGILQAETALSGTTRTPAGLPILELDRKPSSCPYLFAWNGRRFEFVTDFMGGGEMGYWLAPGVRNEPDPTEYVRMTDTQLQARDGRFEIRVTNELEETAFIDHIGLLAVTHPADLLVFPDEGLRATPRPFRLFGVRGARPPAAAYDDSGRDVLDDVTHRDRRYPDDFERLPIRGYAREHTLTIDVPADLDADRSVLLLTGWTDYAFSRDNVAAHQAGVTLTPPTLQVRATAGRWETVDGDVGFPAGRPQTIVVEIGEALSRGRQLRLVTNMRIYWDQILVGTAVETPLRTTWLPRVAASLRWRGFSAESAPDGREPLGYDYDRVGPTSPWKLMPGHYTREGPVEELLRHRDDRFVIARAGDELALSFDAQVLPPPGQDARRTFLLYTVGYSKEMDFHSASPNEAAPIPFRGMSRYPYAWPEQYPHAEDLAHFHTRVVPRAIRPLLP